MHSIATCPQCAAQVALPPAATANDYAVCPECKAEFSLADGDQRWLAMAELIPPPEAAEPEPVAPAEEEPVSEVVELEVPTDLRAQQTIEFTDPLPVSGGELPEAEATEAETVSPQEPSPVTLGELKQNPRTTETLLSTSALSDWEERLRNAIDTPAPQEEEQAEHQAATKERTPLEDAPEFDFHMDPPAEKPPGPEEIPVDELSKTAEWFQNATSEIVDHAEPTQEEATVELPSEEPGPPEPVSSEEHPHAGLQPLRKRRKKNSLLRLATVFTLFAAMGLIVGQYALLWVRGPSADYMGMMALVPQSMLPSPTSQILAPQIDSTEVLAAEETDSEGDEAESLASESSTSELLADNSTPVAPEPKPIVQDPLVVTASAEESVEPRQAEKEKPVSLLPPSEITPAEFTELVDEAGRLLPAFLTGDLSTKEARGVKGQAYMTFCRLAERLDVLNRDPAAASTSSRVDEVKWILDNIADSPIARRDLAFIAQKWWGYSARKSSGIVFIGQVERVESQEGYTIYHLSLSDLQQGPTIPVALVSDFEFSVGDSLGIAGTIVPEPHQALPNYSLDLPQVVVSNFVFAAPTISQR